MKIGGINSGTDFESKCRILADVWLGQKNNEELDDFFEYNDLGLPLAYMLHEGLVVLNEKTVPIVDETFESLLETLDLKDEGFRTVSDLNRF